MIYDYLFYAGYQLGLRSRKYANMPILGGLSAVAFCLGLNLQTLAMIVLKFFNISFPSLDRYEIAIVSVLWLGTLYLFYKPRCKRIIEKYNKKREYSQSLPLFIILLFHLFFSIAVMLSCAKWLLPKISDIALSLANITTKSQW